MLIDAAMSKWFDKSFDEDGAVAKEGAVNQELLDYMLAHEYFARAYPKTTGREMFGKDYFEQLLKRFPELSPSTWVASLTALTTSILVSGLALVARQHNCISELYVAGGGLHNCTIMDGLRLGLPHLEIQSLTKLGIDPDAREAVTFALLAHETLQGRPGNLPSATGARRPAILGKVAFPPPQ